MDNKMVRTELVELEVMLANTVYTTQQYASTRQQQYDNTRGVGRAIAANTMGTYYHCFCWTIEN